MIFKSDGQIELKGRVNSVKILNELEKARLRRIDVITDVIKKYYNIAIMNYHLLLPISEELSKRGVEFKWNIYDDVHNKDNCQLTGHLDVELHVSGTNDIYFIEIENDKYNVDAWFDSCTFEINDGAAEKVVNWINSSDMKSLKEIL